MPAASLTRHLVLLLPLAALAAAEGAGDNEVLAADESGWSHRAQIGGFFTSVTTRNTDDSRDASLSGASESISYLLNFDGALDWRRGDHSIEQMLVLKFGRQREQEQPWIESTDLIDYDGAYKYHLEDPHFLYGGWGADSVFTGSEPDKEPLDPFTAKISVGYGQAFSWAEPERSWEWRVGARAQKRWARNLDQEDREIETGIEFVTRYEAAPIEDLTWWIEYEAFSEFEDLGHITNLLTANFNYKLFKYLTLKLALRAFYETEPENAETEVGYDELSWRQETLLGITYDF